MILEKYRERLNTMENNKRLNELKNEYVSVPIPQELDATVRNALQEGTEKRRRRTKAYRIIGILAASFAFFTAGINMSPAFAQSLSEVPGMGGLVRVLSFTDYQFEDKNFKADLKVPVIDGLENKSLEATLNAKYLEENKKLYEQFMAEVTDLKEQDSEAHMGIDTGYAVKTDNERIFSIGRYVLNIAGSSSTVIQYDTIDKQNQVLITLPSLFKDDQYIPAISDYIQQEMLRQMQEDEGKIYWVRGADLDFQFDPFEQIKENQSFYINPDDKLVISFDKYEVAPGYMGVLEFIIPTEILTDLLVSNNYLH